MKAELGPNLYLFRTERPGRELVITAHGGIKDSKGEDKKVPFGELRWYCDHKDTTVDLGIEKFFWPSGAGELHAQWNSRTTGSGKPFYDYSLSKYQGKPEDLAESYEQIDILVTHNTRLDAQLQHPKPEIRHMASLNPRNRDSVDVLTIRNRFRMDEITLSWVLDVLQRSGYTYPIVHCYFCRSTV